MTFYALVGLILAAYGAFCFWRGRRFERKVQRNRRGGYLSVSTHPGTSGLPFDWEWPSPPLGLSIHEGPHPLYDRIHDLTPDTKET